MTTTRERMLICDLPNDLETEILSRVPAKSLWELKTTCKRWYGLFRDPKFVEKNKKLGEAVRESMLLSNLRVYSIAGDLHGLHNKPSIEFTGSLKVSNLSKIFHCDGLMLCTSSTTKGNTRLVVWNPCTGQRRSIKARTCYGIIDRYAIGYTTSCGLSYKILRFGYNRNDKKVWVVECEIYELSSGSWRVLDSFTRDYAVYRDGMSLKGDTYFVAGNTESGAFLIKFDFTRERFVRLPLPIPSFAYANTVALSVVRGEKLSVLHSDDESNVIKIWVTDKVDEETNELSWRSGFVLRVDFDTFELRDLVMRVSSFFLDEENKVAVVCCDVEDRTRIHIVGEDMYKLVYKEITHPSPPRCRPLVITYVPSLVQI